MLQLLNFHPKAPAYTPPPPLGPLTPASWDAGKMVCILVGAASLALALSVGRAAWAAGQRLRGVVTLGIMSLRCNALMAVLGVAHHTGQVGMCAWARGGVVCLRGAVVGGIMRWGP